MRLAVDAAGGDFAPVEIIKGSIDALKLYHGLELVFTGDFETVMRELSKYAYDKNRVRVVHAPEIIGFEETPTIAIRRKKDSSLVKALQLVEAGEADCMVSAGSTGAVLAGATFIVKRLEGVKRPALAPLLPTMTGGKVMLLDCGANAECKPEYLLQFAAMGTTYMKEVLGCDNPKVALLNNGTEESKGNDLTKEAFKLLKGAPINFVGNCEGREALSGFCDVLVCDGFTGNIALKSMEGMAINVIDLLKKGLKKTIFTRLGAALAMPALKSLSGSMDYKKHGGAILLGINGCVIKAHGNTKAAPMCITIKQCIDYVNGNVLEKTKKLISSLPNTEIDNQTL